MTQALIQVKVVLLGDSGVGKSSIVLRFVADCFKNDADATVGASYTGKILQYNDQAIKFNIWDTAGQERYHALAKMYYRDATAAVLIYDITKKDSFEGLKRWHHELISHGQTNIPVIIVGNKEDLVQTEAVSQEEASEFAKSIGALYRKASAKTNIGIEQIFIDLASKIFPGYNEYPSARRTSITVSKEAIKTAKSRKGCC